MRLRGFLLGILAAIVIVIPAGLAWVWRSEIASISVSQQPSQDTSKDKRVIQHGAGLAAIGNCHDCHISNAGKAYAGGRSLPTPFGTIFSSNITPDDETGIGTWSEVAFARAMREGVDRQGRQLYPAFPYDHFTKATSEDISALYAFLMSQTPVRNAVPPNALAF